MEATIPYLLNLVAICIAVFGVYQSAIRDYEQQRDEVRELRRQLDDCRRENQRLHEAQEGRSSGINISGGAVTIGHDAVGGDESKRDDLRSGGDMNVRKAGAGGFSFCRKRAEASVWEVATPLWCQE